MSNCRSKKRQLKIEMYVHTFYIAQVKRMCGLGMGENYNKSEKEKLEVK